MYNFDAFLNLKPHNLDYDPSIGLFRYILVNKPPVNLVVKAMTPRITLTLYNRYASAINLWLRFTNLQEPDHACEIGCKIDQITQSVANLNFFCTKSDSL